MMLRWILKNLLKKVEWIDIAQDSYIFSVYCRHGNERLVSIKCQDFPVLLIKNISFS